MPNNILDNIANDQDLDFPVQTNLDAATINALDLLAYREADGNRAEMVRRLITAALRQRAMLPE